MTINYIVNFYKTKILPFISFLSLIYQFFFTLYYYTKIGNAEMAHFLPIIKDIHIFFYFMSLVSFIMTYITEPGYVTLQTNREFLCLYQKTRKLSLIRAEKYNKYHELKENNKNNKENCDLKNNEICQYCYIVKHYGIKHCLICNKCIYMKDHHCSWINKCIGQFNIKYFILFLLYLFLASYISFIQNCYFIITKKFIKIIFEYSFNEQIFLIIFVILDIIYVIISIKLLYDQYNNLDYYSVLIDNKKNTIIEIRSKYEIICEYFGEDFSIGWFFPFKPGGFYKFIHK